MAGVGLGRARSKIGAIMELKLMQLLVDVLNCVA